MENFDLNLTIQTIQSVPHVHSFIRDFFHPTMDPQLVNQLLEGVETPTLKDRDLLFQIYGIDPENRDALFSEITKMIESYM